MEGIVRWETVIKAFLVSKLPQYVVILFLMGHLGEESQKLIIRLPL